jgi:hypothetical protein
MIDWAKEHDDLSKQISQNGTDFILNNLMFDDIYHYLYLALIQYAEQLDETVILNMKQTKQDNHWIVIYK